mgnify:FL=1
MPKTAKDMTPQEFQQYLDGARKRQQARERELEQRRERALALAHQAADLLKRKYGVDKVVLFGSLTQPDTFTRWSDVDLAAFGLTQENSLKAMSDVAGLDPEIEVNLVDAGAVKPSLLEHMRSRGRKL